MKKLLSRVSAYLLSLQVCVLSSVSALAATQPSTKGMGNFFEKVYDAIFGESLDSFFEKHRDEIQLRVKTGIIVFLFVLVVCAVLITYFLVTKKRESPEDQDDEGAEDDAEDSDEDCDIPDDLDELED